MQPGGRPFGWSVGAGYDREDASQLDQRYEAKYARADITVPVSANVALLGGVGYENIEIGQRSALLDVDGNPVIDNDGRFVTDKDSPRRLSYAQEGLIWDVSVMSTEEGQDGKGWLRTGSLWG